MYITPYLNWAGCFLLVDICALVLGRVDIGSGSLDNLRVAVSLWSGRIDSFGDDGLVWDRNIFAENKMNGKCIHKAINPRKCIESITG